MPWLEDLIFPRGYQMGTHKKFYKYAKSILKMYNRALVELQPNTIV